MSGGMSAAQVGLALKMAGLSPSSLDIDMFRIVQDGENYFVYTDRLPEIYIEKVVQLECYDFKNDNWNTFLAMNLYNSRRTPVVAYRGCTDDTVSFRICIKPESFDDFQENLNSYFEQIGYAVNAFGQACEVVGREDGKDNQQ